MRYAIDALALQISKASAGSAACAYSSAVCGKGPDAGFKVYRDKIGYAERSEQFVCGFVSCPRVYDDRDAVCYALIAAA